MRDHRPSRALDGYVNQNGDDRRVINIPQARAGSIYINKYHTVFLSQHYDRKERPFTLWEPFPSKREVITWDKGSQTLTMGLGTTIFCSEIDRYSFLMALTVAEDVPEKLKLDVQLHRGFEYSKKWFEQDEALFQNSAAHTDTYSGQLSPEHQLDIRLRKGPQLGEGCWYIDINVLSCEPELPDESQSDSSPPDSIPPHSIPPDNKRPSKSRRFMSIFLNGYKSSRP